MRAVALLHLPTLACSGRLRQIGKAVAGLINLKPNPAHKRSPLIVLSADGRNCSRSSKSARTPEQGLNDWPERAVRWRRF